MRAFSLHGKRVYFGETMSLTIKRRLRLCLEILLKYEDEKEIGIFQRGYKAGLRDGQYEKDYTDREFSKLGSLIEGHWDDKEWILSILGMNVYKRQIYLNNNRLFERAELESELGKIVARNAN